MNGRWIMKRLCRGKTLEGTQRFLSPSVFERHHHSPFFSNSLPNLARLLSLYNRRYNEKATTKTASIPMAEGRGIVLEKCPRS
jgi:hypothetical protein